MDPADLPRLPLGHLRCSRSDQLRTLLQRRPELGHQLPAEAAADGDRGTTCYRSAPGSFFVQVGWRRTAAGWEERDATLVPGTTVALRLVLDDLDPARVTRLLQLEPTRAFAKGSGGPSARRFRDEGLWILEVLPQGCHWPESKLQELLGLLRGRPGWREVLQLRAVTWAGVTVQLRGAAERLGGFVFDAALLEGLVGLSLQLDLELFAD